MNLPMAWRSAVGAPTPFHHELNHGETGKSVPLWGRGPPLLERPIHGGLGGHFMVVWTQFMVFWIHGDLGVGAPETAPPPGQAHPHSQGHGLENSKD